MVHLSSAGGLDKNAVAHLANVNITADLMVRPKRACLGEACGVLPGVGGSISKSRQS
jgi:hypothetical protein